MSEFEKVEVFLKNNPSTWLITGCAGFIGSNLVEYLLSINQKVLGIDNLSTGSLSNLDDIKKNLSISQIENFHFSKGDINDSSLLSEKIKNVDHVLHQAALGSVPRSIDSPIASNESNVSGFLNILNIARQSKIKSFTYASSSSVYGDHESLPKQEHIIGDVLSPYALTKKINEQYASIFSKTYGFKSIGLRYFNVFGPRQSPSGPYAAVIPQWISAIKDEKEIIIYGDGETSRDFCFIQNVIEANILAATSSAEAKNKTYNVAFGEQTTLNELADLLILYSGKPQDSISKKYNDFRKGDVRHSLASIEMAKTHLGYSPRFNIVEGIKETLKWYLAK